MVNPVDNFDKYFSVQLAMSEEQKRQVYALRYRVYCKEFGFLPSAGEFFDKESGLYERDDFDDRSYHILVTHKKSGLPAACLRLVTTSNDIHEEPLPLEKHCLHALPMEALESINADRFSVGEVSRLAVDSVFRNSKADLYRVLGYEDEQELSLEERRLFPLIGVAALLGAAALAEILGKTTVLSMMAPVLSRRLKTAGFHCQRIGKSIDYYGQRAPYQITAERFNSHIPVNMRDYYRLLSDRFVSQYGDELDVYGSLFGEVAVS